MYCWSVPMSIFSLLFFFSIISLLVSEVLSFALFCVRSLFVLFLLCCQCLQILGFPGSQVQQSFVKWMFHVIMDAGWVQQTYTNPTSRCQRCCLTAGRDKDLREKKNREAIIFETAAFSSNQNNTPSVPQGITSPSIFCSLLVQGQDLSSLKDWTEPEEEEELDVCHSRVPDHTADLFEHDYR